MTIEAAFASPSPFDPVHGAFVMYANETLQVKAWLINAKKNRLLVPPISR